MGGRRNLKLRSPAFLKICSILSKIVGWRFRSPSRGREIKLHGKRKSWGNAWKYIERTVDLVLERRRTRSLSAYDFDSFLFPLPIALPVAFFTTCKKTSMKFLHSIDSNVGEKVYFYIWSKVDSVLRVDGRAICISQQKDVILPVEPNCQSWEGEEERE